MKRLFTFLLLISLLTFYPASAETDDMALIADMEAATALTPVVEAEIHRYDTVLHGGHLDRVQVNPNYGTEAAGDYIVLAYMTFEDHSDPAGDCSSIVTASCTVSTAVRKSCPDAVELCVFWELPGYDSQAKIQFVRKGDKFEYGDAMLPVAMAETWGR